MGSKGMQLTKEYLTSKYDYDPQNECFIYKENPSKRVLWNERFQGKRVKPIINGDEKYITVNNAIYPLNQLIKLWEEGVNERLNPTTIEELSKKDAKRKALISSMSVSDLKHLQKQILNNEKYRLGNRKASKSPKANNNRIVARAKDLLNVEDIEVNEFSGYPRHIYYDGLTSSYYVKVSYRNQKHYQYGFENINDALKVRNQIYKDIIQSET